VLASAQSGQIFEGDEIVSLNSHNLETSSYRQAAHLIKTVRDGPMTLNLRTNPNVYELYKQRMAAVQASNIEEKSTLAVYDGTSLCVRALYSYDPDTDSQLSAKDKKKKLLKYRSSPPCGIATAALSWRACGCVGVGDCLTSVCSSSCLPC
jgi:disks large protein 1